MYGLRAGQWIVLHHAKPRWWVRLWRWLTRYKPPAFIITNVTETTFTIEAENDHDR